MPGGSPTRGAHPWVCRVTISETPPFWATRSFRDATESAREPILRTLPARPRRATRPVTSRPLNSRRVSSTRGTWRTCLGRFPLAGRGCAGDVTVATRLRGPTRVRGRCSSPRAGCKRPRPAAVRLRPPGVDRAANRIHTQAGRSRGNEAAPSPPAASRDFRGPRRACPWLAAACSPELSATPRPGTRNSSRLARRCEPAIFPSTR